MQASNHPPPARPPPRRGRVSPAARACARGASRSSGWRVGPLSLGRTHRLLQAAARPVVLATDAPARARGFGREPVLTRSSSRGSSERGRRSDATAPRSRDAGGAGARTARRTSADDTRARCCSHRPRGRPSATLLAAGRQRGRARTALCRARDRARGRGRSASRIRCSRRCVYQGVSRGRATARTRTLARARRRSDRCARATLRFRRRAGRGDRRCRSRKRRPLAITRGAPIAAAELGEHALRLTPAERARTVIAARSRRRAPTSRQARRARPRAIALDLLARTPAGPARAEALVLLADLDGAATRRRAARRGARRGGSDVRRCRR